MLLPVHLDRHEPRVELGGELRIAETLPRHHVAPVAGRIPDRDQHRDVAPLSLGESLRSPRKPVDRVVGVRPQVGTDRIREPIRHAATLRPDARAPKGCEFTGSRGCASTTSVDLQQCPGPRRDERCGESQWHWKSIPARPDPLFERSPPATGRDPSTPRTSRRSRPSSALPACSGGVTATTGPS